MAPLAEHLLMFFVLQIWLHLRKFTINVFDILGFLSSGDSEIHKH